MDLERVKPYPTGRLLILLILASLPALVYFLWRSQAIYRIGFPLDDAWIHQTYARNLATRGEWTFLAGKLSAGSTAPLWTGLLSLGYIFSIPNQLFSFLLGGAALIAIVWMVGSHLRNLETTQPILIAGLLLILLFEWHLLWAALSGMETLLLGLHILVVLWGLERDWNPVLLGALVGLGVWVRPDAILATIPVFWVFIFKTTSLKAGVRRIIYFSAGLFLLVLPYVYFNFKLGGEWWPSTFYAKQVEYAVAREASLPGRVLRMGVAPLVGPGFMVVPGIILDTIQQLRRRAWWQLAGLIWVAAFISAYALRLPVDYQHGRYMMPVIPALYLLGFKGMLSALKWDSTSPVVRVLKPSWLLSLILVTAVFWVRGAEAYATDVAVIESEMVASAEWIASNTEPDDWIAAHDIGALGFYSGRRILDLAGLVSPEVVPILRDEAALEVLLDARQVDFLMTFPGWYPKLTKGHEVVFSTKGSFSPSLGGENMTVYLWR